MRDMSEQCLAGLYFKVKLNPQSRPPREKLSGAWTIPLGVAGRGLDNVYLARRINRKREQELNGLSCYKGGGEEGILLFYNGLRLLLSGLQPSTWYTLHPSAGVN